MSGSQGKINQQLQSDRQNAQNAQNQIFQIASQPNAQQQRFDTQSASWDNWLKGKDYSQGPEGSILNFDLASPAHAADIASKMNNITGTGATALGGNDSTALQLAKHHDADVAGQNAGASYENAVQGQNAYFQNSALPWSQTENAKWGSLFGQTSGNTNALTNAYAGTATQSLWPTIIGGTLGAAGNFLGGPGAAGI